MSKMCLKLWTKTHTQSRCPKGCLKVCRKVSCPRQNTHTLITITLPIGVWLITYSLSVSTDTGYGYVYHGVGTAGNAMQYIANQTYCVSTQWSSGFSLAGSVVQYITASTPVYLSAYYNTAALPTFGVPKLEGSIMATRIA